jgi:hypothetical protein
MFRSLTLIALIFTFLIFSENSTVLLKIKGFEFLTILVNFLKVILLYTNL